MSRNKSGLVKLLMLALLVMPWQGLYAQTQMLTLTQADNCQHEKMRSMDTEQSKMSCCEQDKNHCDQSCGDCFHCQTLTALTMDFNQKIDSFFNRYFLPVLPLYSGLPPEAKHRPPRIQI